MVIYNKEGFSVSSILSAVLQNVQLTVSAKGEICKDKLGEERSSLRTFVSDIIAF